MPPRETQTLALSQSETSLASTSSANDMLTTTPVLAATKHLLQPNGSILGSAVAQVLEPLFPSLLSAIPSDNEAECRSKQQHAIASIDGRTAVTHSQLIQFVEHEMGPALQRLGVRRGHRVALVLPNGPELAVALTGVIHWASAVPLNANGATSELQADLQRCGADLVIGPYAAGDIMTATNVAGSFNRDNPFQVMPSSSDQGQDWKVFASIQESAAQLKIPFVGLVPSPHESGMFRLVVPSLVDTSKPLSFESIQHETYIEPLVVHSQVDTGCNTARDEALVLFTSGTTGNKKLVPHQLGDLLTAATTIALSWNLSRQDVNCNLMPLFHVGGICRQVLAPLVSGGCVICCPSFDPSLFWALLAKRAFNWYYAAPTMHQLILQMHDVSQCPEPRLRMIANAAGGLLPSLAVQLRDTFHGCHVLPSYGMTECMPISSPPHTYQLDKPGTSGMFVEFLLNHFLFEINSFLKLVFLSLFLQVSRSVPKLPFSTRALLNLCLRVWKVPSVYEGHRVSAATECWQMTRRAARPKHFSRAAGSILVRKKLLSRVSRIFDMLVSA